MRIFKLVLIIALLFIPVLTWAFGVTNGLHNLGKWGVDPDPYLGYPGSSLYATNTDRVCVFCHTPHGGTLDGPLWNRDNPAPAGGWSHYNSAAISIDLGLSVSRPPSAESMLCLSCHDGSIAVTHVINPPNDLDGEPIETMFGGDENAEISYDIYTAGPGKRIGASWAENTGEGQLFDDHPISFSYDEVYWSTEYQLGSRVGELRESSLAEGRGVKFFGPTKRVECSSCHDPHVDYAPLTGDPAFDPFLIMSNAGSNLCLACHNK
jgi:hypothetical protein